MGLGASRSEEAVGVTRIFLDPHAPHLLQLEPLEGADADAWLCYLDAHCPLLQTVPLGGGAGRSLWVHGGHPHPPHFTASGRWDSPAAFLVGLAEGGGGGGGSHPSRSPRCPSGSASVRGGVRPGREPAHRKRPGASPGATAESAAVRTVP